MYLLEKMHIMHANSDNPLFFKEHPSTMPANIRSANIAEPPKTASVKVEPSFKKAISNWRAGKYKQYEALKILFIEGCKSEDKTQLIFTENKSARLTLDLEGLHQALTDFQQRTKLVLKEEAVYEALARGLEALSSKEKEKEKEKEKD